MIRIISDVHGQVEGLERLVAELEGPLLILGDLINIIDYRTLEGIATDVSGRAFMEELVRLRTAGDYAEAGAWWRKHAAGREQELRDRYEEETINAYEEILPILDGVEAYVTYGNADRPNLLASLLPESCRFVDGEVVEIDGFRVGFVGGGTEALGAVGERSESDMVDKLAGLGPVDILCTHVPPAIRPLMSDVIGGRMKGSDAVLAYLEEHRPEYHYFGDIHQPVATRWRHGDTTCVNVGFFRATWRAVTHERH